MTGLARSAIHSARHGTTAILSFANPPLHLIDNKGAAQLCEALAQQLDDPAVRAIVLTGSGKDVFIRHADVAQIARAGDALADGRITPETFRDAPFPRLGRMLDDAQKPVIAAIDGICMGGGLEIAIACTMRIAGPGATRIGLPEMRLGIFPGSGGTQRLARLIGWQRARLFALRGEVVDAPTALVLGLVDEIADDPLDRALAIAAAFEQRNAATVAAVLALTRSPDLDAGLDAELIAFATLLRDDVAVRERLARFVQNDERLDRLD